MNNSNYKDPVYKRNKVPKQKPDIILRDYLLKVSDKKIKILEDRLSHRTKCLFIVFILMVTILAMSHLKARSY